MSDDNFDEDVNFDSDDSGHGQNSGGSKDFQQRNRSRGGFP